MSETQMNFSGSSVVCMAMQFAMECLQCWIQHGLDHFGSEF